MKNVLIQNVLIFTLVRYSIIKTYSANFKMSKLLTVFGATGQQGGSLINHILNSPELSKLYRLRGVTRDGSKQAAINLKSRGVEIVEADLDKPPTLVSAIKGSCAVFAVTNCKNISPTQSLQADSLS